MNAKNIVLGIGIVVVFALALWQGVEAFYPSPQYDDFCDQFARPPQINVTQAELDAQNTESRECQEQYNTTRDAHAQRVFIISIIVALLAIIVGFSILSIEPVGSALIGSGIWSIFWGTLINWRNFSDIWRFLLLLVALVLLIVFAIRLNRKKKKKFWPFS